MWFLFSSSQNRHKIVPISSNFSAFFFYYFQNNFLVNFEPTSSSLSSSFFFSLLDVQPTTSHILSAARSSKFWLCSWPNSHVHFDEGRGEEIIIIFFCYFSRRFFSLREGKRKNKKERDVGWCCVF